ncbi:MAG: hypothetical protein E7264_11895 [Lachnospiraceae bacterium]|nr:hypothetical protein [Lachnospiraceae bacterium]
MIQALACIGVVLHHVTLRKFSFERNQHHKHGDFSVAWYFLEEHFSWGTNVNSASKANRWDMKGYRSSWWWLRGEKMSKTAPIVTEDGIVLTNEKYVNKPNGAVRPVVWVQVE